MNATNRIPISVRITQEDADFIAELKIEGANTPSEKIRELLKLARLAHTQTRDYSSALTAQEQFSKRQNTKSCTLKNRPECIRISWRGCLNNCLT